MNSLNFSDDSGDESSDLDYRPPDEEEKLSEIESDDAIEDDESNAKTSTKIKKTTKKQTKRSRGPERRSKKIEIDDETVEKTKEEVNNLLNSSVEDKKRLDALWEEFQRPVLKKPVSTSSNTSENKAKSKEPINSFSKPETSKKRNFEELFESSDLSKKVPNNDDNTTRPKSPEIKDVTPQLGVKTTGGLANILNQIGKKSKMTILEKSKQDWDGYKKKEGIVEELITHNKGKDGYLEKRDFLERTDLRQFELEKAMRAANRSRRN